MHNKSFISQKIVFYQKCEITICLKLINSFKKPYSNLSDKAKFLFLDEVYS